MPPLRQLLILGKIDFIKVVRQRNCELNLKLLQGRLTVRLRVNGVERTESQDGFVIPNAIGEGGKIKVIASRIALEDQDCLNAKHLGKGWDRKALAEAFNLRRIQRLFSNELANAGLNAIERAQYLYRRANASRFPSCYLFQLG